MRTTINVSDRIIDEIKKFYGSKTKTDAVNSALKDWVRKMKIKELINLRGKIEVDDHLKEMKEIEIRENESNE